ncbi:YggS family pyridoxal phosphate-dependent enzyme [Uliginosibacterium gangwonense]|uniref:YggS family pyridoxal phosphate-dependent enzyme n=1 Tax=Uliginosibacterium gangwonense TaxID=392736 RepID=UPI00036C9AFC|nr:YggS family pyridoxal phosphate-dependent enzyme [Uliginosibacterium gangwonense]
MTDIAANLNGVRTLVDAATHQSDRRKGCVTLLAVSKTCSADAIREAAAAGQRDFGENYLQEALDKIEALVDLDLVWHFIGPIQSNKTRPIASHFQWVHAVDRLKVAQRLSEQRDAALPDLNICLQVNVSGEDSKSGVAPEELPALASAVARLPHLRLRGLMCIPEPTPDEALLAQRFGLLRTLRDQLQHTLNLELDTLSMGMSADMAQAIAAGSTMVRIGTAIFGSRPPRPEA